MEQPKEQNNENMENRVKPNAGELLIIGDEGPANKASLQDNFAKFRDQKMKERKLMKACRSAALAGGRTEDFKGQLRIKFVEQAKRYVGVPYGIKYKKEEDPVAPLYLDCCGLVRQCVQDLQEDFGFVIGKWNQAYQMDTLPVVLTQAELKPGDLIFYEGKYKSNRSKEQKHNNVHVEIYLGGETGEATIGSRFHRGNVSVFPSYKFDSSTWELQQYHFRSLDTWLGGECVSHCSEHVWHSDSLNYVEAAGRKSIFSSQEQEDCSAGGEEQDEEGGGDDEDQGGGEGEGDDDGPVPMPGPTPSAEPEMHLEADAEASDTAESKPNTSISVKKPKRVSAFSKEGASTSTSTSASGKLPRSVSRTAAQESSLAALSKSNKEGGARSYYLGKANGWKIVRDAMTKRGWTMMPSEYHFSNRYGLKWVERRNQIDYLAHVPGQLVCHIPNNDILTTKIGLLCTMREKFCRQVGSNARVHPPWLPHTYDLESPADCLSLIAEEERLASGAASSRTRPPEPAADLKVGPPQSPVDPLKAAEGPEEADAEAQQADDEDESAGKVGSDIKGGIWIYKPSCANRGRGIRVVTGVEELRELTVGQVMGSDPDGMRIPYKGIVQKYIRNPLLLTPEGYKFDIRVYLLVARNYPTTLAFYHPGYVRMALKPYSVATKESLEDECVHLTNASIQKKHTVYKEEGNKEAQVQGIEAIAKGLDDIGKSDSAEYMRNTLDHEIKLCLVDLLKASNHIFLKRHGYFDLLGCDFMLSASNKLSLLEVNTNPALTLDNSTLANMLPGVVDATIELVMQSQGPDRRITDPDDFLKSSLAGGYQLIFDEGAGYMYKPTRKGKSTKAKAATEAQAPEPKA